MILNFGDKLNCVTKLIALPISFEDSYSQYKNNPMSRDQKIDGEFRSSDISENTIRKQMPDILDILLTDRTTSTAKKKKNIIWANENYVKHSEKYYAATAQIKPDLITRKMGQLIMPRALKSRDIQKNRTKSKAEVFTPTWVVKKQNDVVEAAYLNDNLETYVKRKWLEITCGEAPYMATRYDMETGDILPLEERAGFVDRKLTYINSKVNDKAEWQRMMVEAYKSSYGFEWNGDSLLLARENLLYTYRDYYFAKWQEEPLYGLFKDIAEIISYNIFQMDGLKYIIPLSDKRKRVINKQLTLFDDEDSKILVTSKPGKRVKIMNWSTKKMEYFDKGLQL
ncbi:restriction endonuclease [Psychrobacter sp. AOP42-A1-21]|uniref:restriction endonuclease n=1 Tax=Psychrobacter sp. AOP42-A1-21 TaxID=3457675 RepID=UPI004035FD2D